LEAKIGHLLKIHLNVRLLKYDFTTAFFAEVRQSVEVRTLHQLLRGVVSWLNP